jgi:phosphohistidine phosphatase
VQLFLLRHGLAEEHASGGDRERALTDDGIAKLREVLERAAVAPRWIVASPYRRAQQTARIAAEIFGYGETILTSARLTPDADPRGVWEETCELAPDAPLLFVAHNPLLSRATQWFTGQTVPFEPAALACLEFAGDQPRAILKELRAPA